MAAAERGQREAAGPGGCVDLGLRAWRDEEGRCVRHAHGCAYVCV